MVQYRAAEGRTQGGAGAASSTVLIAAVLSTEWTDLLQGLLEYPPRVGDLRRAPVATTARAVAHPMPAAPIQIRTRTAARSCAWRMTRRLTRGDLPAGRPTNDLRKALLIGSAPPCAAGPGAAGSTATGRLTMCASAARRGEVAALLKPMKRGGRTSRASTAAGAGRTAHLATGGCRHHVAPRGDHAGTPRCNTIRESWSSAARPFMVTVRPPHASLPPGHKSVSARAIPPVRTGTA